jgi:hypothetical protein
MDFRITIILYITHTITVGDNNRTIGNTWCVYCRKDKTMRDEKKYRARRKLYENTPKRKAQKRELQLKRNFNLTSEQYNQMFEQQQGCCAICNRHQSEFKRRLIVEHNHDSNKIRGLVCHNCNSILGHAHDDINILLNAIEYLRK